MKAYASPRLILTALVVVQILFGINYVVSKAIVGYFPPLVWASTRSIVTVVLMGLLVDVRGQPHPKPTARFFAALFGFSLIGIIINQGSFLVGLFYTTPTNSAVLNTLIPIFTLVVVIFRGQEKLTWMKLCGFACSFAGVLVPAN